MNREQVLRALAGWEVWRTPSKLLGALRDEGPAALDTAVEALNPADRQRLETLADAMADAGVGAAVLGEEGYPTRLAGLRSPPPILMYRGSLSLLETLALGVCGARAATEQGLAAASRVGEAVAEQGWVVVAGNALGVDKAAQSAAYEHGGGVIVVLPDGIAYNMAEGSEEALVGAERSLMLSQFPATQPWSVGGAMARNATIAALGEALVVIEAGGQGGTKAAGETALRMGRPVFTIQFSGETPPGNLALIRLGAVPLQTPGELVAAVGDLRPRQSSDPERQLALPL